MTNFSFDETIPAPDNNPSEDQPLMLINNLSTFNLLNVDHRGFEQENGGMHKAIHFDQIDSYVPVPGGVPPGVSPPQLFTNTFSGLPQLFWYSGIDTASSLQYSAAGAANFSTFLLGGFILKGGTVSVTTNPQAFTYAGLSPALSPFITNTLIVLLSPANASAAQQTPYIFAKDKDGFTVANVSGVSKDYYFLAIGY